MLIRAAKSSDADGIVDIYNHYISNTVITFEEDLVSTDTMRERINKTQRLELPWLVATDDDSNNGIEIADGHANTGATREDTHDNILGYAYANPWRERSAYRFSIEVTVYLSHLAIHRGIGSKLYDALFSELKKTPVHAIIGVIALPNAASVALHEKFGMTKVAHFEEVGFKFDRWIDVGYWQVNL